MNRKDQIEHIEKEIDRLQKVVGASIIDLKEARRDLNVLATYLAKNKEELISARKNALIVRYMNAYIEKGLKVSEAILKTAEKMEESPRFIQTVYAINEQADRIAKKQADFYLVQRMKSLKYPNREIAKVAGYSEKYVYDLIKQMKQKQR